MAEKLISELHSNLVRMLSDHCNHHFQGLSQASRCRLLPLTTQQRRRLAQIDTAYNITRHITSVRCRQMIDDISKSLTYAVDPAQLPLAPNLDQYQTEFEVNKEPSSLYLDRGPTEVKRVSRGGPSTKIRPLHVEHSLKDISMVPFPPCAPAEDNLALPTVNLPTEMNQEVSTSFSFNANAPSFVPRRVDPSSKDISMVTFPASAPMDDNGALPVVDLPREGVMSQDDDRSQIHESPYDPSQDCIQDLLDAYTISCALERPTCVDRFSGNERRSEPPKRKSQILTWRYICPRHSLERALGSEPVNQEPRRPCTGFRFPPGTASDSLRNQVTFQSHSRAKPWSGREFHRALEGKTWVEVQETTTEPRRPSTSLCSPPASDSLRSQDTLQSHQRPPPFEFSQRSLGTTTVAVPEHLEYCSKRPGEPPSQTDINIYSTTTPERGKKKRKKRRML